jgi:Helix-turn-helix
MHYSHIKAWRKRNGFTQTDLARALGVSRATVGDWESGRHEMAPEGFTRHWQRLLAFGATLSQDMAETTDGRAISLARLRCEDDPHTFFLRCTDPPDDLPAARHVNRTQLARQIRAFIDLVPTLMEIADALERL